MPETAADKGIRILIVEDNHVVQQYLQAAILKDQSLSLAGIIDNGEEAVHKAVQIKPDVILLDIFLPGMDGIEVIHEIMSQAPCPIIVISGELDRKDRDLSFEAQRSGAVEVMAKPKGMSPEKFEKFSTDLCHTIRIMSGIKVTTRRHRSGKLLTVPAHPVELKPASWNLVVIGSSTGGPAALYRLLSAMSASSNTFSILIAQHMTAGFADTFCNWLKNTGCQVKIAGNAEKPLPGWTYLANDNLHLVLGSDGLLYQVDNPGARFVPSVDMLFESVANHYKGSVCAIVLTGMGNDGTHGMLQLHRKGATCIAEDESSCVIFGMPRAAINAGATNHVLSLDQIETLFARKSSEPASISSRQA